MSCKDALVQQLRATAEPLKPLLNDVSPGTLTWNGATYAPAAVARVSDPTARLWWGCLVMVAALLEVQAEEMSMPQIELLEREFVGGLASMPDDPSAIGGSIPGASAVRVAFLKETPTLLEVLERCKQAARDWRGPAPTIRDAVVRQIRATAEPLEPLLGDVSSGTLTWNGITARHAFEARVSDRQAREWWSKLMLFAALIELQLQEVSSQQIEFLQRVFFGGMGSMSDVLGLVGRSVPGGDAARLSFMKATLTLLKLLSRCRRQLADG